jgi:hypothetical protein
VDSSFDAEVDDGCVEASSPSGSEAAQTLTLSADALHGLLEQLDGLQVQVLEHLEVEKASEGLVAQLRAALDGQHQKLRLMESALSGAETALKAETERRKKAEAALAKEVAQRKALASKVVEACVQSQRAALAAENIICFRRKTNQ